jgi:hypothetical protein
MPGAARGSQRRASGFNLIPDLKIRAQLLPVRDQKEVRAAAAKNR